LLKRSTKSSENTVLLKFMHVLMHTAVMVLLGLTSGLFSDSLDTDAPSLWLPAGYAVAVIMLGSPGALISTVVGALIGGIFYYSVIGLETLPALGLTWYFLVTPITTYLLYRPNSLIQLPLTHYRNFLRFLGAVSAGTFVGTLPAPLLTATGYGPDGYSSLLIFWISGVTAIMLIAPPMLAWRHDDLAARLRDHLAEVALWILAMAFTWTMLWNAPFESLTLILPMMAWAATRFSLPGSIIAIGFAAAGSLLLAADFLPSDLEIESSMLNVTLISVMMVVAYYIRVLLFDREQIEIQLESEVTERTSALTQANLELEEEVIERHRAERSLRQSSGRYRALFEAAGNPIIVIDRNLKICQWNGSAERLFGYSCDEALGQNLIESFVPKAQRDELTWKALKLLHGGADTDLFETTVHSFEGTSHTLLWNMNRLPDAADAEENQLMLIGQDITKIRETQDQLHYLAHYDVLTDTANRRLFEDRCHRAITSALRRNQKCALIGIDIDHFKRINDTLGHDAGDELLKEIAKRLQASVREEDTISRLGGDEFAVLLSQVNGAEGCEKVARSILEAIVRPIHVPGGELVITSSIGITIAPDDGSSYEQLLKNADMAMYRAKRAGRNTLQFFSQEMNEEMQRQMVMERDLRAGIRQGELDLHYQPILEARTGKVIGLEALLRWNHPEKGLLCPRDFLEVAEQTGQLQVLGEWVCMNACLQARAIQHMSRAPVNVRINLSSRQYNHPKLADELAEVLRQTGLDPELLLIEIDERILSARLDETAAVLQRLKKLGIGLVLDRFGSGLSSLRLLRELPFDQVKIDQHLMQLAPRDENTAAIVHTLINLARQLSLTVAAAGIENAEQHAFLHHSGCHLLQGHRFSAPLPSDELAPLFKRLEKGESLIPTSDQISLPFGNSLGPGSR